MTRWSKELEEEAFGLCVYRTPAFSVVCTLLSLISSLLEEVNSCHVQLKVTVTYNSTAVPSQSKASAMLVSPWSTSQSTQVHCYLVVLELCILFVHCLLIMLFISLGWLWNAQTGMGDVSESSAVLKHGSLINSALPCSIRLSMWCITNFFPCI